MSVMITGGTGFLGSYLARHLVQQKGETGVVLYDLHPNSSALADIEEHIQIVRGDVLEPLEIVSTMRQYNVDRVIHLAFIMGGSREETAVHPDKVVQYLRICCMGAANVFDACRILNVKRVVYASSVAVHGFSTYTHQEVDEDVPAHPDSLYGTCKLWYEHIADVYHRWYGLDIIGLRPTMCFGLLAGQTGSRNLGMNLTPETPSFMALIERAALGETVVMPPDDLETDWMYAADAAEAWYLALTVKDPAHRVFNMRSERRRMGDVTAHLRRILPDSEISVGTELPPFLFHLMNNDRLRNELGFKPRYTMETGMTHFLNNIRSMAGLPPVAPA